MEMQDLVKALRALSLSEQIDQLIHRLFHLHSIAVPLLTLRFKEPALVLFFA